MPPLVRALLEAFLDDAGVFEVRVDPDGSIWEDGEPLRDPAMIAQAAIQTDIALELLVGAQQSLTAQGSRFGLETVERLADQAGIEGTQSFYDDRRGVLHAHVSDDLLKDALRRTKRIINKDAHRDQQRSRTSRD